MFFYLSLIRQHIACTNQLTISKISRPTGSAQPSFPSSAFSEKGGKKLRHRLVSTSLNMASSNKVIARPSNMFGPNNIDNSDISVSDSTLSRPNSSSSAATSTLRKHLK